MKIHWPSVHLWFPSIKWLTCLCFLNLSLECDAKREAKHKLSPSSIIPPMSPSPAKLCAKRSSSFFRASFHKSKWTLGKCREIGLLTSSNAWPLKNCESWAMRPASSFLFFQLVNALLVTDSTDCQILWSWSRNWPTTLLSNTHSLLGFLDFRLKIGIEHSLQRKAGVC